MVDTKTPGEKTLECPDQDLWTLKPARRAGHRAPELQPWPDQAGGGRECAGNAGSAATRPVRRRARARAGRSQGSRQIRADTPSGCAPAPRSQLRRGARTLTKRTHRRAPARWRMQRCANVEERRLAEKRQNAATARKASEQAERKPRKPAARPRRRHRQDEEAKRKAEAEARSVSAKPRPRRGGDRRNSACRTRARRLPPTAATRMKVAPDPPRPRRRSRPAGPPKTTANLRRQNSADA